MNLDTLAFVPAPDHVGCIATAEVRHRCPHRNETDFGTIRIEWTAWGRTIELHSLRDYLDQWSTEKISHEALVTSIQEDLTTCEEIDVVSVTYHGVTSGLQVEVRSHPLLREPVNRKGE